MVMPISQKPFQIDVKSLVMDLSKTRMSIPNNSTKSEANTPALKYGLLLNTAFNAKEMLSGKSFSFLRVSYR